MPISTFEGFIEDGQIRLRNEINIPEQTRVYVVVPDFEVRPDARIRSPRLVHPEHDTDFEKQVIEVTGDAGL